MEGEQVGVAGRRQGTHSSFHSISLLSSQGRAWPPTAMVTCRSPHRQGMSRVNRALAKCQGHKPMSVSVPQPLGPSVSHQPFLLLSSLGAQSRTPCPETNQ